MQQAQQNIAIDAAMLNAAIKAGQLSLHYQPKVEVATGRLIGVEALARWTHPEFGPVAPSVFIPLAERSDLIHDLTASVLHIAARQGATWRSEGYEINIAVNVSARNLDSLDFPDKVYEICAAHSFACRDLTIELTESAAQEVSHLLDTLTRLRLKGSHLALDDFGTGYSSLVQLHQLPFSEMKIDRSFVMEMDKSRECQTIVKSIVDLAHNLDLTVVAEGVETNSALEQLRALGCDVAQGYLIAKPMPAADVANWMIKANFVP